MKPPSGLVTQPCVRVSRMSPTCCVMRSEIKLGGNVGSVWLKGVYILLIGQTRAWKFSLPHTPTTNPMLVGLDRSEFGRGVDCAKPSPIWPSDSQMGCWKMDWFCIVIAKIQFGNNNEVHVPWGCTFGLREVGLCMGHTPYRTIRDVLAVGADKVRWGWCGCMRNWTGGRLPGWARDRCPGGGVRPTGPTGSCPYTGGIQSSHSAYTGAGPGGGGLGQSS